MNRLINLADHYVNKYNQTHDTYVMFDVVNNEGIFSFLDPNTQSMVMFAVVPNILRGTDYEIMNAGEMFVKAIKKLYDGTIEDMIRESNINYMEHDYYD